jgi:hypothetical protein
VLHWVAALADRVSFGVRITEAPHYLRVAATRRRGAGLDPRADPAIESSAEYAPT